MKFISVGVTVVASGPDSGPSPPSLFKSNAEPSGSRSPNYGSTAGVE